MAQGDAESFYESSTASTTIDFRPASGNSFVCEIIWMQIEYNCTGQIGVYSYASNEFVSAPDYKTPPWYLETNSTSDRTNTTHTSGRLFFNNDKGLRFVSGGEDSNDGCAIDAHLMQVK